MVLFPPPSRSAIPYSSQHRIGHLVIAIECRITACRQAIDALCALYEKAESLPADLHFLIAPAADGIRLSCDNEALWHSRNAGEIAAAFEYHLYSRIAKALGSQLISLHASALAIAGRAVLFAGSSGSGKSSLATQALLCGFGYLSDEFALLDAAGQVHPFPRPLQWGKVRHPAFYHRQLLASGLFRKTSYRFPDRHGKIIRSLLWLPKRVIRQPQAVHALILPRFSGRRAETVIEPVRRSQALIELAHEIHQRFPATSGLRLLHEYLPDDLPVFRLCYGNVSSAWRHLVQEGIIPLAGKPVA